MERSMQNVGTHRRIKGEGLEKLLLRLHASLWHLKMRIAICPGSR